RRTCTTQVSARRLIIASHLLQHGHCGHHRQPLTTDVVVCREYIPNGPELSDDGVDEVRFLMLLPCHANRVSTLLVGHLFIVWVFPLMWLVSSASWPLRMENGSTARFSVSTVLLACKVTSLRRWYGGTSIIHPRRTPHLIL